VEVNVLVAGGAGAAGSYLCGYIAESHPEVQLHVISRWHSTTTQHNLDGIKGKYINHECDLNDLSSIVRTLRLVKPDKIFNTAAHANVKACFSTPLAVLQNNMMGTANLLEAIRLECPDVIYNHCSTSEVYGSPKDYPITEAHPLNPVNAYALSKLCQEKLTSAYWFSYRMKSVITRAFAYICPRRLEIFSTSFAYQVARIEAGKQDALRHGNLSSIRTLIDCRDIVRAYWVASEKCEYGVPYNIGGLDVISVEDFLKLLIGKAKVPIKCIQDSALLRPVDIDHQIVDISRFVNQTGWKAKYTLEESVDSLLEDCREKVSKES
jgi:GDP-4-dehydro-6-deoxy-D-mannose reductase